MVFESLVVELLNRFLGDYVENLDRSQLKLGIWGGDVSLKNLDVKESALDEFDLPVKVIAGHLGHLKLSIPWKNLYTAPVVATIDKVFVVAVPNLGIVYNEEKEKKALHETKVKELQRIEDAKLKEMTKKNVSEKKDSFTEKLVAQIIKNLQIRITQIHVRYEDTYTNPARPFSAGMTLNNLAFETTNENWVPSVLQDAVKMIHKLVSLDSFALYWNSDGQLFSSLEPEERQERMISTIAALGNKPKHMTYILGPVSSVAKLILNPKPETDGSNYSIPKIWVNLNLQEIAISLTKSQYKGIMELLDSLDRMTIAANYRKYRPSVPRSGHLKEWWKFAMKCVLEEEIRRKRRNWSWRNMHNHRTLCKLYKQLYKDKLSGKKFTLDKKKELELYEVELDVFNITLARKQAEIEVSSSNKKDSSARKGWFNNWFNSGGANADQKASELDYAKKLEEAMNPKEKAKLYEAIGYQENATPMEYPPEFVERELIFILQKLILSIVDDTSKIPYVLMAELHDVGMEIQQRPSADALKVVNSIGAFTVYGCSSDSSGVVPKLVTSLTAASSVSLLSVTFETNPLDKSCDQRLHVSSRSLQITYDAPTINNLVEVLKPPESISLQQLQAAAYMKLDDFKELSAFGLQYAIERHKIFDLSVDLKPSYVVIPEGGVSYRRGNQLVINLGYVQMHSIQSADQPTVKGLVKAGSTEDEVLTTMMSRAYDRFEIKIQNVAVLLVSTNQTWESLRDQQASPFHLLQPLELSVILEKAIIQDDPRLPKVKIAGELPVVKLGLSDVKLIQVLKLVTSIPLPENEPAPAGTYVPLTNIASASTESGQVNSRALRQVTKGDALAGERVGTVKNVQMTELQMHFVIKEIALELSHVLDAKESPLINFCIYELGSILSMHTFDMTVDLFLGGITVQYLEFNSSDGSPLYIVQTPMTLGLSEKLFTIRYVNANKRAPNFATIYNSTLQLVKVDFTNLDAVLHQEAILSLLNFVNHLSASLEQATSTTSLSVVDSEMIKRAFSKTDVSRSKKVEEVIDIQIDAIVGSVGLTICNLNATICVARVKGFETGITVMRTGMSMKALLKDLLVSDPSPNAVYPKILSTVYGDVVNVNLEIYNDATEGSGYLDMSAVDMRIAVSLGRMKIVFLNKYVSAVLAFLDQFQTAKEKMSEASMAAALAARQGVESAYDKASRVGLDICLQAPVIIVPQNSSSNNVLLADFGTLTLKNTFRIGDKRNELGMPSMFDDIFLGLQSLKLSRALLDLSSGAVVAECLLLEPISFGLQVVRNLTINWYRDDPEMDISGQLAAVYMSASHEDYMTVMKVLSENLGEGVVSQVPVTATATNSSVTTAEAIISESVVDTYKIELQSQKYKRMKFNIVLESLSASLYQGSSQLKTGLSKRQKEQSLGCFQLKTIAVTGEMLSDSSMWANVILVNCILEDTRSVRKTGIMRLMESTSTASSQSMIDVTYRQEENQNTFVDVQVHSFSLIVCLDYLLTLKDFFLSQEDVTTGNTTSVTVGKPEVQQVQTKAPSNQVMSIQVHLEKPDLVLIENIEDIDSSAVIFHNEVIVKVKMTSDALNVSGVVSNLELFTASYNPLIRDLTMQRILDRCDINLIYNAHPENQHVDIHFTDINIHINPYTVQLLSTIFSALSTAQASASAEAFVTAKECDVLWIPKKLSGCAFWFLNKGNAKEALDALDELIVDRPVDVVVPSVQKELLVMGMPTIIVTVEAGIGSAVLPLILLESSFGAEAEDWSSNLQVKSTMEIEIASFNEKLAVWEPLLEPVDGITSKNAWTLNLDITKNCDDVFDGDSPSEETVLLPPVTSINISSRDTMEVTITRTCLDVISNLAKAFGDAVHQKGFLKFGKTEAPYIVENHLGIQVTVVISGTRFQVMNRGSESVEDIVLEQGTSVELTMKDKKQSFRLSTLQAQETQDDLFFSLKIETDGMKAVRTIYVTRLEKRFYQLPVKTYPGDHWGFVVNTSSIGGTKIISLQSVVQVFNHLEVPVEIFYMQPNQNEQLESCGVVIPDETMFIPTYALYTHKNEIFFKPQDKALSSLSFVWKDLMKEPQSNVVLSCDDKETGENFYLQLSGEMEQVFHEYSNKKTMLSARYQLHLSPPIILRNLLPYPIECRVQGTSQSSELLEGQSAQLVSARLGKSEVIVTVKNYFDKNWTCTKKLDIGIPDLSVWSFEAEKKCILDLGIHAEKIFGSISLSVYCPFWMVNKTELLLIYRGDDSNTIQHPPNLEIPVLFSFRAKSFFAKKKAALKVEDSEWSDKFAIDVVGSSGNVIAKTKGGKTYVLGVQIKLSKCGLTKIIIFTPFNLLVNNSLKVIECMENVEGADWISVPPSKCIPFWLIDAKKTGMVARYAGSSQQTAVFSYKDNHSTLLQLVDDPDVGINVECRVGEMSVIVNFGDYFRGSATVLLINDSAFSIDYSQSGLLKKYQLQSQEAVLYTWENPTGARELTWSCGNAKVDKETLMKDDLSEYNVDQDTKLYCISFLDGLQRVLLFTHDVIIATNARQSGELERVDQEITLSLHGFGLSLVNNLNRSEVMYVGITSTGVIWEGRKSKSNRFKSLLLKESEVIENGHKKYQNELKIGKTSNSVVQLENKIEVDFNEMIMLKPSKRVLRRTFLPGLWLQLKNSTHELKFHAKVNRLQIDNQLHDYVFPVVLSPVPLPKSVAAESVPKPFAELSVIQRVITHSNIIQIKYFKALIQEFSLKVDQGFLNAILAFFATEEVIVKDCEELIAKDREVVAMGLTALAADYFSQEQKNFFDLLHLSPLKVHLSFSMTGRSASDGEKTSSGIQSEVLNLLLQSVGVTLTEVQDVVFKFNYFEKTSSFLTNSQLMKEAVAHYSNQAIKQLYVLVLGLDVIGNPVGLLLGLRSGVGDLFYEPFQGAIQGPEEFAEGVVLGLRSLVGHTVGGAAGAFSRITGTLGKGIAALTMDEEYQKKRRQEMSRRTGDIGQGLAQGGRGLLMGVVEGVTGVVTKPIAGARQEGFEGFVKGVGKGLIGVVARPTTGVIDFASGSLDAVKRAADLSAEVKRIRLPRYIKADGIITPYSALAAEGNKLLLDVEKGKYAKTDNYVAHVPLMADRKAFLMVTSQRVIFIRKEDVFGQWDCEWHYTWDEIKEPPVVTEKGIKILLKEHKKKKMGFWGGTENGKVVNLKDPELCRWIAMKMEETMRQSLKQSASADNIEPRSTIGP